MSFPASKLLQHQCVELLLHSFCVATLLSEAYEGVNMPESQKVQVQGQQTSKVG